MIKNALKYDFKPQDRSSAKIKQNYKIIKESIASIAFEGYQQFQICADFCKKYAHHSDGERVIESLYGKKGGRVGVSLKLNFMKELTGKRMKIIQTPGGNKTDTNLCRRCMAILLKHKFKTRLAIIIYTHILIFKIININWGLIPIIYIIIHYLYLKILSKKMIN